MKTLVSEGQNLLPKLSLELPPLIIIGIKCPHKYLFLYFKSQRTVLLSNLTSLLITLTFDFSKSFLYYLRIVHNHIYHLYIRNIN
jgi:hypothetical protein